MSIKNMTILFVVALVVAFAAWKAYANYGTARTVTFNVESKERIDNVYTVFGDTEVFQNRDTIWFWKFNSADVYTKTKVGQTCTAKVNGFRVPFLSRFRNIINITCETKQ